MEDKKRILIFAGCNDKKLISKISPILDAPIVEKVYLVRLKAMEYSHSKLKQYPVPSLFSWILPLREVYRIFTGIYLILSNDINLVIGFHFIMHGIYTAILSKVFRLSYIFMFIESPDKYKWDIFLIKMIKNAQAIGVRGSNSKEYLAKKGVDREKIFIPPNEFEIPNTEIAQEEKIYDLIYIGNFVDIKDLPLWVECVSYLKKEKSNVKGVMLGDGKKFEDIKNLVKAKGLEENIELVGRRKDVFEYINKARILLLTSKTEALPMVAVECMSLGVPTILPNVGDVKDLIKNDVNGFLIDSRDPKIFAESILEILNDDEKYKKISEEAIRSIEKLSKDSEHSKLVNLWSNILERIN